MGIVGVPADQPAFSPADDCCLVNTKALCRFIFRQHSAFAKSIIARAEIVFVDEIRNAQGIEASIASSVPRRIPCRDGVPLVRMSAISE